MTDASSRYNELRAGAKDRLSSFTDGKTRVVVQVGHTSQALGAQQVADAIGLPGDGRITWRSEINNGLNVSADRDQLYRVLLNLGRNAVQAIPAVGEIRVAAAPVEGGVKIEVADTGTGLPNAAREHLFEAFIGAARAGGTGLGLAIARDMMRAHGGAIELVESGPSGTRFRLFLPQPAP